MCTNEIQKNNTTNWEGIKEGIKSGGKKEREGGDKMSGKGAIYRYARDYRLEFIKTKRILPLCWAIAFDI